MCAHGTWVSSAASTRGARGLATRARTSRLAVTPVAPRTISRGSRFVAAEDAPAEQFAEDEQPRSLGDAGSVIGTVCRPDRGRDLGSRKATVRAVPRPMRPNRLVAVMSSAVHAKASAAGRRGTPAPRRASITARARARARRRDGGNERGPETRQREVAGPGGVVDARQRGPRHQDTPAVSPVRARRASWGRNCGAARIAAASGSRLKTACIDDPSVARIKTLQRHFMAKITMSYCQ